jgi:hypothetical protein
MNYQAYLNSRHWQNTRRRKLKAAHHRCRICRRTDLQLHVHHLNYDCLGRERNRDLRVLCHECHSRLHELEAQGEFHHTSGKLVFRQAFRLIRWEKGMRRREPKHHETWQDRERDDAFAMVVECPCDVA